MSGGIAIGVLAALLAAALAYMLWDFRQPRRPTIEVVSARADTIRPRDVIRLDSSGWHEVYDIAAGGNRSSDDSTLARLAEEAGDPRHVVLRVSDDPFPKAYTPADSRQKFGYHAINDDLKRAVWRIAPTTDYGRNVFEPGMPDEHPDRYVALPASYLLDLQLTRVVQA